MSPFMKGALGFLGCAGIFGAAYAIGKRAGREETLREVEQEEMKITETTPQPVIIKEIHVPQTSPAIVSMINENEPENSDDEEIVKELPAQVETAVERVRNKRHGIFKNKLFEGVNAVKDLLSGNTDGKKLVVTVEDGDVVARLSQKGA